MEHKIYHLTILSVQLSGIKYIAIVVQPSPRIHPQNFFIFSHRSCVPTK